MRFYRHLMMTVLLVATVLSISAQTRYVKTTLNLRYGPGTNYGVQMVIPKGTVVTIDEECDCKWVPVSYRGKVGYLRTSYLSKRRVSTTKRVRSNAVYSYAKRRSHSYRRKVRSYNPGGGATALCNDGTYSYSANHRGTCSHHGGVAEWYR